MDDTGIPTWEESEPIPMSEKSKSVPTWEESEPIPMSEKSKSVPTWEESEPIPTWEEIEPPGGGFFGPKRSDWNRMRAMFSGEDPYAAAASPENRQFLEGSVSLMPDPDAELRKIAVTAYMSRMKRENVSFVYDNLDKILETYYGKKTSVDEAFKDIGGMLLNGRGDDGSGTGNEIFLAAGSGLAGAADFALSIGKFLARYAVPHDVTKENPFENLLKRAKEPVSDYRATLSGGAKTKTIAEAWKAGETGTNLVKLVAEEGPALALQLGTVFLTGGSGPFLMGGVFTEDKREQLLKENPEMSLGQMGANLAMTYIINTIDSAIDMKVLKGASAPVRKEITESIFYALKHIFKPVLIEGGTEGLQRMAENGADYITGVYDKEIAAGAKVSDLLVRGVPEEALLGAISGAGMSALGFRAMRDVDRMNNVLLSTVDKEIEELRNKETPSDEDISNLHKLEELRDAGNAEGMRSVLVQRAIREYNRSRPKAEDAARREAEMTVDDRSERHKESYRLRKEELLHNPEDTAEAVVEVSRFYPGYQFEVYDGAENMPPAARREALRLGYSPRGIDALILGNTCYVNKGRLRPSDVPKRVLEEVAGHRGLRAVFGDQYDSMLDGVYRDFFRKEEFQKIAKRYFRPDQLDTVGNQRYATEEFLAHNARMTPELKPSWWKEFLQKIKMALRKLPGFQNLRFTDRELERILMRGIAAVRDNRAYQANSAGGDVRFAAYRRPGAPNFAEDRGQLRDGNVPCRDGFLQDHGFNGNRIYADYEFLRGKHPEYFPDVEYARAVVEFVLNDPIPAGEVNGNPAFIRKDTETGTAWRIELRVRNNKQVHVRSAHQLSGAQYEKMTGRSDTPESVRPDRSTASGNRPKVDITGHTRAENNVSDFLRYDSTENGKVKFSIIGESGAERSLESERLLRNLSSAREMERRGEYDAGYIKFVTGWERGKDGKWRTENSDDWRFRPEVLNREFDEILTVGDAIDAPELFSLYPELRDHSLAFLPAREMKGATGYFDRAGEEIAVSEDLPPDEIRSTLIHEIQHWIQEKEGFARGGNLSDAADRSGAEQGDAERFSVYRRFAGEVEARNAERRAELPLEERLVRLLKETEDVAEEDKIYLERGVKDGNRTDEADGMQFSADPESGKAFPLRMENSYQSVHRVLREMQGKTFRNADTGIEAKLSNTGVNKLLSNKARAKSAANGYTDAQHLQAAANVDRLFENSVLLEDRADRNNDPNIASIKRFAAPFYTNGDFAEALITLKESVQNGARIYSLELNEIRKPSSPDKWGLENQANTQALDGYNKLQQKIEKARVLVDKKEKNMEIPAIRFSLNQYSDADGSDMVDRAEYSLETAVASKAGYRVERVNENAGREFNGAEGTVCIKDAIFSASELPETGKMKWIKERSLMYSREHGILGSHETPCLGSPVEVTEGSISNDLNHRGTAIRQNMIAVIPEMLKNAVLIQTETDERSKTHILAAKVRYGEERFAVGLVINESNGKYFYDHELTELNAIADGTSDKTDASRTKASVLTVIRKALLSSGFDKKDDRNIRFSLNQYSDADWSDMVGYMKAKVGTLLTKPDADYRRILEEAGMECFSDADAHAIAAEAMEENKKDHREQRRKAMIDWLMKNNLWFQRLAEATGTPDFVIRPSFRFQGEEFSGSYISRAWVEYSGKPDARNRDSKLKEASGYHSDELAQMIADKYGGDAIEIENEMIEYFRHKKRRASKTDRENGEKGFYDEYDEFRKEERLFNKELDRLAEAQWVAEESLRVEQAIAEIIENKQAVDEVLAETDRNVFTALYQRVMKAAAPGKPTSEQLDALNAALYDSGDPEAFVRGWNAGRDHAIAEKRREHIEFAGKVLHEKADALKLQREAAAFAEKHVPKEQRGEFIRGIVGLADHSVLPSKAYPEGKRKAKLEELFAKMIGRGEEVRKAKLIEQTERLFRQAGLRADAGRKQRNVLSFDVQKAVDRIREYADMTLEEAGIRAAELQTEIENTEAEGNMSADLEYETRLLDLFGDYRNKSASEIELAYRELKALVSVGRSEMKEKIHERARDMMTKQTEIRSGLLNGKKELSPQERRTLEAKRRRAKVSRSLLSTLWQSNTLDSLLSYLPLPSGRESGIIRHLQERLHTAYSDKMTRNRHHTDDLEAKLNELAGLERSANGLNARKTRAELIRKWRERPEHTGIMRHQPDDKTKFAEWIRIPETEARAKLEEFRRSGRDFEAAALEHLLNTEKLRIRKPGSSLFGDSVTDALVDEMRKKRDEDTEKAYHVPVLKLGFNPVEENLTQLEALYMKLMWNQRNIRYKMRFNGWTESSIRQIDAYLRPEVAALGEWMTMQLEKDRSDISQVYERLYFSMFPHEENYFPSVFNQTRETMDGKITLDLSEEGAGGKPMACTPGAVKLRAFHLKEPRVCDALTIFVNHRQQMDHFVTHGETARELRSLFLNKDVAQTIRDVYGNEFYDQLKKEISDFIAGGNVQNQNTQFAQFALNNWARVKMLWNVASAGKQMFGGLSYFQFSGVPGSAMVSGIADFWKHPLGNAKRLMETEYFKTRWQGGMNRELKMIMDSTGLCAGNFSLFMREMDHWGFMAMRGGDAFAVLAYGHAVYKYHYDQLIKRGMAPHEADRQAKTEWAIATERTQQSGATHMLNSWQKGNFAQKALVTFLSNPTLLFQSYSRDIYSSVKFGTGKWPAAKKLAVSGILSLIMAGITQLMRHGVEWDEYDLEDVVFATLADQTTGWVGAGTILNAAYSAMGGSPAKSMPVLDDVGRAVRSGYRVGQALKEDDLSEDNFRDALNILQGLGLFWAPAAHAGSIGREIRRLWRIVAGEERR